MIMSCILRNYHLRDAMSLRMTSSARKHTPTRMSHLVNADASPHFTDWLNADVEIVQALQISDS